MSLCIVTGVVKDNAKIVSNARTPFLAVTLIERRTGFGTAANRVFKTYFKVIMFGREIDAVAARLTAGTIAEASGEAQAEAYKPNNSVEWKAVIKIVGKVSPVLTEDSIEAPAAAGGAPESDPY